MKKLDINNQNFEFSTEAASQTLKNVFEACEKPQNVIPLELLENKHKIQTRLYRIANSIAFIGFVLVIIAIISFLIQGSDPYLGELKKTESALEQGYEGICAKDADTDEKLAVTGADRTIYIPYSREYKQIHICTG